MQWFNINDYKVGDVIMRKYVSGYSLSYAIVKIEDNKFYCRLLKNETSEKLLKENRKYCSKDMILDTTKFGSLPCLIKLNNGIYDTDEIRKENLKNIY